jgi:GntR family histidine utilization transcriptional repressor
MTGPLPRYAEIRRKLEAVILSGEWAPGHPVPSEHELAGHYNCSRMTVNKALSALAAAGLIVRRRRSGSFVATPSSQQSVLSIPDIEEDVRRLGKRYSLKLLARSLRKATKADAARLEVKAGTPVLALKCLHFANGKPLVAEDRLINLATVPAAREADFSATAPGSWLLAQVPWWRGEHRVSAVNASRELSSMLRIAPGAACLRIERTTWQVQDPVTQVILHYPGDRHHLLARLSATGGG